MFRLWMCYGLGMILFIPQLLAAQESCGTEKVEPLSEMCHAHMVRLRGWIQSGFPGRISPNSKKLINNPQDNPAAYAKDIDTQCRTSLMDSFLLDADSASLKKDWKALPRRIAATEEDPFAQAFNEAGKDNKAKRTLAEEHDQISQQVITKQAESYEQLVSVLDFFVLATIDNSQLTDYQNMRNTFSGNDKPGIGNLYISNEKCNMTNRFSASNRRSVIQIASQQHKPVPSPNLDELIRRTSK